MEDFFNQLLYCLPRQVMALSSIFLLLYVHWCKKGALCASILPRIYAFQREAKCMRSVPLLKPEFLPAQVKALSYLLLFSFHRGVFRHSSKIQDSLPRKMIVGEDSERCL